MLHAPNLRWCTHELDSSRRKVSKVKGAYHSPRGSEPLVCILLQPSNLKSLDSIHVTV